MNQVGEPVTRDDDIRRQHPDVVGNRRHQCRRGSKTTVLYTPPKRTYDIYGNIALAPSSGAGIATLNPIPSVRPGDIDLIAPFGTIDAGIRVSGNVNLAALQIVNAANISVQGTSSGIPTVQAPSISAALSSSNATAGITADGDSDARQRQCAAVGDHLRSAGLWRR
jgi:hypothetical protein